MPQIDFGKAFFNPNDKERRKLGANPPVDPAQPASFPTHREPSRFRRSRLGRSGWANIIFVLIAVAGGLFCAFYFFNGAELMRMAAAWPREFLYPQPAQSAEDAARSRLATSLGLPMMPNRANASDHSGDPFSRAMAPLSSLNPSVAAFARTAMAPNSTNPNVSGSPGVPGLPGNPGVPGTPGVPNPNAGSLLSGLGLPIPGGDALMKTFNRAVADLDRLAQLETRRVVIVEKKPVVQIAKRAVAQTSNAVRGGVSNTRAAVGQTAAGAGQAGQTVQQIGATTGSNVASAANQVAGSAASTVGGVTSSALGTVHATTTNVGGTVGRVTGGVGGVVGGLRGGVGGGGMRGGGGGRR